MRTSRLVDNRTNLPSECATFDWIDGSEVIAVVAKATFEIDAAGEARLPLFPAPIRRGDGSSRSNPIYPNDMAVPHRPGTDVIVVGSAVPRSKGGAGKSSRATKMNVSLRVLDPKFITAKGNTVERILIDKTLEVMGPRTWTKGLLGVVVPSPPEPLEVTPLIWENTYGGSTDVDGIISYDPRNPVGSGFGSPKAWLGQRVPPIQDPAAPIASKNPAPAGFGPVQPGWQPRAGRYGTTDETWRRERRPLPPEDIDVRCYSCAPDDQWVETPLTGGELFQISGMHETGTWSFRLPRCSVLFETTCLGVVEDHRPPVDTVVVDCDEMRVELSFRIAVPLPRKTEKLTKIAVMYGAPQDPAMVADLAERYRAVQDQKEAS